MAPASLHSKPDETKQTDQVARHGRIRRSNHEPTGPLRWKPFISIRPRMRRPSDEVSSKRNAAYVGNRPNAAELGNSPSLFRAILRLSGSLSLLLPTAWIFPRDANQKWKRDTDACSRRTKRGSDAAPKKYTGCKVVLDERRKTDFLT